MSRGHCPPVQSIFWTFDFLEFHFPWNIFSISLYLFCKTLNSYIQQFKHKFLTLDSGIVEKGIFTQHTCEHTWWSSVRVDDQGLRGDEGHEINSELLIRVCVCVVGHINVDLCSTL